MTTSLVVLRILVFLTLCAPFIGPAAGQTTKAKPRSDLSEGISEGFQQLKVLDDDPHTATFRLSTSWIPGEGHKGYIRFRLFVTGDGVNLKEAPAFIERIHACDYTLELDDKGGFVLRRIPLTFVKGVAASGDVTSMLANDIYQMDLAEYKSFIAGSSWGIPWSCSK
jgi:hypothetical protein